MAKGRYGDFGGQYIPETLMNEIHKLEEAYEFYKHDKQFNDELNTLLREYAGRPSLLYYAEKMTKDLGGAKIYLKREDLNHTGSHKINNALGQCLLAVHHTHAGHLTQVLNISSSKSHFLFLQFVFSKVNGAGQRPCPVG